MSNIRIRLIDIHQVDALDDAIDFILTSKPIPQGMSVEHLSKIQKQLNFFIIDFQEELKNEVEAFNFFLQ